MARDFLSDLHLGIIHTILALVPIRDAVKTSILSRKWRYKWASLLELVFDDECAKTFQGDDARLIHFIHQALFLHEGPIHKFKLHVQTMERCSYTDQWLIFLSRNDIRMLILHVENYPYDLFEVHSSLYSCQNLTHLQLLGCAIPLPPPTFKGFLCLRCLVLDHVYMAANTIESLVANSSHLLEELVLESNFLFTFDKENLRLRYNKMRIRAPNLKCFYFRGFYSGICLYAPLLAKLRVFIARDTKFTEEHLRQKSPVCNYTKFLGGFPNLEELSGNIEFMKYLSIGIESCQRSLVFQRLRLIELSEMECDDIELISVFVHLIMGAPNLHKLIISCDCYDIDFESTCISWDSEFAPNLTFGRLKVIEMSNVYGGIHWMRLIKFLLERSPVLEMMILKPNQSRTDEQLLDMMAQVLRFRRASTNAEILF